MIKELYQINKLAKQNTNDQETKRLLYKRKKVLIQILKKYYKVTAEQDPKQNDMLSVKFESLETGKLIYQCHMPKNIFFNN